MAGMGEPGVSALREVYADVIMRHWRTSTSGCDCGQVRLGESWPLHLADVLLALPERATLDTGVVSPPRPKCPKCDGCGRIGTDDEGTPWTFWENLPVKSAVAVVLGLVRPVTCPVCKGSGVVLEV